MNINAAADEIKSQHGKAGSNVPSYVEVTAAGMAAGALAAASNDGARVLLDLAAPRIGAVLDSRGSIQGEVGHEGYTDDGSPKISGLAAPGVLVHIYDGVMLIGRVTADASGSWSFTPRIPLAEGRHELSIAYEYANGDISDFSDAHVIHVDKSNPELPEILGMVDDEGRITGVVAEDDIIDDARPTVSGTAEPHATVIVYDKGKEIGRATVDAKGDWSFTPGTALKDGTHLFSYSAVDRAGNQSEFSEPFEFIVDTRAERVTIHMAEDGAGSVTGLVYSGGVTDDTTPTLMGTATAGGIVKLYEGGVLLGQTTAEVDGTWSFTPNVPLADGAHTLSATVTLPAKGESALSKPFDLVVETVAASQPTIETVHDNVGLVQGVLAKGAHTDDRTPTLSGKAEAGCAVRVYDNQGLLGSTTANAQGVWTFTPSEPLLDGQHAFTVVAVSAAGNSSVPSDDHTVLVDTVAPAKPIIDYVQDDVGAEVGALASGDRTDDGRPSIHGSAEPGSTVIIKDGGIEIGRVQADGAGRWSFDVVDELDAGWHALVAEAMDVAGNTSAGSDVFKLQMIPRGDDAPRPLGDGNAQLSVTFIADTSGSMSGTNLDEMKTALRTLVGAYAQAGVPVSFNLIRFDESAYDMGAFTFSSAQDSGYAALMLAINGLVAGGGTYFEPALNLAMKNITAEAAMPGYSADMTKHVFFLSDGSGSLSSTVQTKWHALMADPDGNPLTDNPAVVTSIGIGSGASATYLNAISTSKEMVKATDVSQLSQIVLENAVIDRVSGSLLENDTWISQGLATKLVEISHEGVVYRISSGNLLQVIGDTGSARATYDAVSGKLSIVSKLGQLSVYMSTTGAHRAGDYSFAATVPATLTLKDTVAGVFGYVAVDSSGASQASNLNITVNTRPAKDGEAVRITAMGKDSGLSGDFVTGDAGTGRLISGELSARLEAGMALQVSIDNGQSWRTVTSFNGLQWMMLDKTAHAGDWSIQTRLVDKDGNTGGFSTQAVTLAEPPKAPLIARIAKAEGVLTATEANGGVDMLVSLASTGAKAGDLVHVRWGVGNHSQVLTSLDVLSGEVVVKLPSSVTGTSGTGQGVLYDFDVSTGIVANGVLGAMSPAYHVIGGGFASKVVSDTLNVATTNVVANAYTGNGVTVGTVSQSILYKVAQDATYLAGLKVFAGSSGNATVIFTLDAPVTKFSVRLSGLDNAAGGAMVIVYDVHGGEVHRQTVTGTLSSGRYLNSFAYTAAEGIDVGSFKIVSATGSIVVDAFSQTQAVHLVDSRDAHKLDDAADTYYGSSSDDVMTLSYAAANFLASTTSGGIHGGNGKDTLVLAGANHVMNLNLATSIGKLTGVEVIDLTGTGNNTLTLSLKDVLENGQVDLFHGSAGGTVQMMIKGNVGDVVNLDDLLGANGVDLGDWLASGAQIIGGSSYQVYLHSGLDAELLVEDAVKVNLI